MSSRIPALRSKGLLASGVDPAQAVEAGFVNLAARAAASGGDLLKGIARSLYWPTQAREQASGGDLQEAGAAPPAASSSQTGLRSRSLQSTEEVAEKAADMGSLDTEQADLRLPNTTLADLVDFGHERSVLVEDFIIDSANQVHKDRADDFPDTTLVDEILLFIHFSDRPDEARLMLDRLVTPESRIVGVDGTIACAELEAKYPGQCFNASDFCDRPNLFKEIEGTANGTANNETAGRRFFVGDIHKLRTLIDQFPEFFRDHYGVMIAATTGIDTYQRRECKDAFAATKAEKTALDPGAIAVAVIGAVGGAIVAAKAYRTLREYFPCNKLDRARDELDKAQNVLDKARGKYDECKAEVARMKQQRRQCNAARTKAAAALKNFALTVRDDHPADQQKLATLSHRLETAMESCKQAGYALKHAKRQRAAAYQALEKAIAEVEKRKQSLSAPQQAPSAEESEAELSEIV